MATMIEHSPLGRTGLRVPPIVFGTSCLGNLYAAIPWERKRAIVGQYLAHVPAPVVLDTAGKYGAGLALESIGRALRELSVPPENVLLSNKLGWKRMPLRGPEPTFEPGAWVGLAHDAEQRIGYEGILECWQQGCDLLGPPYRPQLVSVHDPDEYLTAGPAAGRAGRFADVLAAYRALGELLAAQLDALTAGDGPAVVIEAIGLPETFRAAVEVAAFAGRVVYIGYVKEPVSYETRLFVQKELDVFGSRNALPADFESAIRMLEAGRFPAEALVSRVVPLAEAGEALRAWAAAPAAVARILVEI